MMENQIQFLERRTRRLERWLFLSICGWLLMFSLLALPVWTRRKAQAQESAAPPSLRVSELVVVDSKGVERAIISGKLPGELDSEGKRPPRRQKMAGIMLYDSTGQERGGYVTEESGYAGLTLDTRSRQVVSLLAAPDGESSSLQLRHKDDSIELRSDDGSRLTAISGKAVFQAPSIIKLPPEVCKEYHNTRSQLPQEKIMRECQRRFGDAACRACLGKAAKKLKPN